MNCETFCHRLLTDPYCRDAAFRAHARACPDCARAEREALRFEGRLREALIAEGSASLEQKPRSSSSLQSASRYAFLALPLLAAALWLGVQPGHGPDSEGDLAVIVIAHIQAEEAHLRSTDRIPWSRLDPLFRSLGAEVDPAVGPVNYAGRCVIAGGEGVHLVLPGERGAVTALFMPEKGAPAQREVTGGGLVGAIVPAGSGSLAIVGEPGEPLQPVANRLLAAVHWN